MDRDELENWLLRQVESTSQSSVARLLGVNQSQVSRWVRGGGELRGVLRDAAVRYVRAHEIDLGRDEAAAAQEPLVEEDEGRTGESGGGEVAGEDGESASVDNTDASDAVDEDAHGQVMSEAEMEGGDASGGGSNSSALDSSEDKTDRPGDARPDASATQENSESAPVVSEAIPDAATSGANRHSSLLDRIDSAETPSELATLASAPVLSEVSLEAARAGAQALARGWRWMRDPPPHGLHGDALFHLHTREEVSFEDAGAKRVAFAPDTEMFECGLTGAELRYGVHPRRRQRRYAVERREDREMRIGIRMASLLPEKPYPDEEWFFGSAGDASDGESQPSAAVVIAARRKMLSMVSSFPEGSAGKRLTPWQLALINEQIRVELLMVSEHYGLTIGEHVDGDRTWAPSTRLGIETRWREAEIARNEAEIRRLHRRRRLTAALLWIPRLPGRIARRVIFELRSGLAEYGPLEFVDPDDLRKGLRNPRVHETFMPSLHEPEMARCDGLATRLLKLVLYPHDHELDGGVCGEKDWRAEDLPLP